MHIHSRQLNHTHTLYSLHIEYLSDNQEIIHLDNILRKTLPTNHQLLWSLHYTYTTTHDTLHEYTISRLQRHYTSTSSHFDLQ